ncbi:unnamed protein product [Paramecium primaurelia]|uniref:EF-hand domain-containing protein n=1 Tax=Paramecium primaurelia TaxID=5886 RepID=A0A8S1JRT8_PARPR|nr:unnamed protein product [Paramecium primaurelia]
MESKQVFPLLKLNLFKFLHQQKLQQKKEVKKLTLNYQTLYRQNLKSKVLFNSYPEVFLSEAECNAGYKLAAALANYDITDERSLKFAEIKCKQRVKLPRLQLQYFILHKILIIYLISDKYLNKQIQSQNIIDVNNQNLKKRQYSKYNLSKKKLLIQLTQTFLNHFIKIPFMKSQIRLNQIILLGQITSQLKNKSCNLEIKVFQIFFYQQLKNYVVCNNLSQTCLLQALKIFIKFVSSQNFFQNCSDWCSENKIWLNIIVEQKSTEKQLRTVQINTQTSHKLINDFKIKDNLRRPMQRKFYIKILLFRMNITSQQKNLQQEQRIYSQNFLNINQFFHTKHKIWLKIINYKWSNNQQKKIGQILQFSRLSQFINDKDKLIQKYILIQTIKMEKLYKLNSKQQFLIIFLMIQKIKNENLNLITNYLYNQYNMTTQIKKLSKLDHTVPIYSPRTTYKQILHTDETLLADLTLNFDPFTINVLRTEFLMRHGSMEVTEFILVVKEHLLSWQLEISNRDIKLIRQLVNLFEEIDLNGNGNLEWEEFTNYIIEKATVLNNIKSKQDEIKLYTKSNMKPFKKFTQIITRVIYIKEIDKIAFFEEGSDEIQFMTPDGGFGLKPLKIVPISDKVVTTQAKKDKDKQNFVIVKKEDTIEKKTQILSMLYIDDPKYQILLTSTHDGYVRGWRYQSSGFVQANQPDNDEEMIEHHFNNDIYSMTWDGINEILYCGQKEGQINIWNLKNDTEIQFEDISHTDVVMDMIAMPKLQFMASASLDHNLILWNTLSKKRERTYKEHTRGIVSLAFNESLILLFSAGFDHNLCVWNPYIESLIFKIQGHSSPVIGVVVIEGTSQIVSLDQEGSVKVWDTKKFNCVQQFSVETQDEKHKFNPSSLCYIPKPLRLIFGGRSIYSYEYDKNYNPNSVDDYVAVCCKFIENQMAFFTPAGTKIKIWNALTGDVKKIYSDITTTEITAFKLDNLDKRFIIGDSSGTVALFNVINGAKIKNLPKHSGEVVAIVHASDIGSFFTGSMDNNVFMTLDNEFGESELLRTFIIQDGQLTYLSYDPAMKHLLAGTNSGQIRFYETDTNKLHGVANEFKQGEEITSINLIKGIPFMFVTNSQGRISIMSMPPVLHRFVKVYTFTNIDPEIPSQLLGISNAVFSQDKKVLYISDDKGFIKCFEVDWLVDFLINIVNEKDKEEAAIKRIKGLKTTQNGRQMLTLPKIAQKEVKMKWITRAHYEVIKSLEYVEKENFLITTAFDKKVKLWDAETGKFIDSFQQNYDRKEPRPIALKRSGTDEIYNAELNERVDLKYSLLLQQQQQEEQSGQVQQIQVLEEKISDPLGQTKSPQEEFNPFYYLEKIDQSKLSTLKSNPEWKLEIRFKEYYENYEQKIKTLFEQVKIKEREVYEKQVKQGIHNRHFKGQNGPSDDDKQFEQNHKPIIKDDEGNNNHPLQQQASQQFTQKIKLEQVLQRYKVQQKDQHQIQQRGNLQINLDSMINQSDIVKELKQQHSDLQENYKFGNKGGNLTPQAKSTSVPPLVKNVTQRQTKKVDPQLFEKLYKQNLKSKALYNSDPKIFLSEAECNAASRFVTVLEIYDITDERSQKFKEIKCRSKVKLPRLQ